MVVRYGRDDTNAALRLQAKAMEQVAAGWRPWRPVLRGGAPPEAETVCSQFSSQGLPSELLDKIAVQKAEAPLESHPGEQAEESEDDIDSEDSNNEDDDENSSESDDGSETGEVHEPVDGVFMLNHRTLKVHRVVTHDNSCVKLGETAFARACKPLAITSNNGKVWQATGEDPGSAYETCEHPACKALLRMFQ